LTEVSCLIEGLFETHINVVNLERSSEFYERILGMELAYEDDRRVRFYWIGERGKAMLGLLGKGTFSNN
jgi:lactoylglutathione lyase